MKILKKIFGFLVNPFSLTTNGRASNKIFDFFARNIFFIFVIALVVAAALFYLYHFVF